jgi:putative transposase
MKDKNQLELGEHATRSVLRLEVNLGAAKELVELFAKDRLAAFDRLTGDVRHSVARGLSEILSAEMSLFLGRPEQAANKRNGTRTREYYLKGIGCLRIDVPRDRRGEFESVVVPAHERIDPRTRQDLAMLHLAGISNRTMAMISHRLLGVEVSKDTVQGSLELLQSEATKWLTRELGDEACWALYIDGTNFNIQRRGSTEKEPSLVVLGVTATNHRTVLSVEPGTRDNVDAWRAVFSELKRRGLDPAKVKIGIMDGLPGLERAFREAFPGAVTARCWVHAMKNALAKAPARLRDGFKELATRVMYADGEAAALAAFEKLKASMANDGQRAVHCLEKDLKALTAHFGFEKRFWRALKTTNAIERVNKEFKRRTKTMDSLGEATLNTLVAFIALKLELGWRHHTIDGRALDNLELSATRGKRKLNTVDGAMNSLIKAVH